MENTSILNIKEAEVKTKKEEHKDRKGWRYTG